MIVGVVVPSRSRIAEKENPSASSKISLARNTYPAGSDRDCAMLVERRD
jgi:hypothetical protein